MDEFRIRSQSTLQRTLSSLILIFLRLQSAHTFTSIFVFSNHAKSSKLNLAKKITSKLERHLPAPSYSNQTIDLLLDDLGYGEEIELHGYFEEEGIAINEKDFLTNGDDDVFALDSEDTTDEVSSPLQSSLDVIKASDETKIFSKERILKDDDDTFLDLASLLENLNLSIVPDENASVSPSVLTLESLSKIANSSNIAYFYLQNELKIPGEDMWKITNEAGSILGMTAKTLQRKVELLRRTMDLTDDDIRTIMKRHPSVLQLSANKNLAPTILFLQRSLDLSREDLRALIVPFPSILGYSITNLKAKVNLFTKILGFSTDECRVLFVNQPKLLTAGVNTGLLPRVQFMLREMNVPLTELRTLIKKNPQIMLYSLEHNLRPKLIFYFIMTLHMDTRQVSKLLLKYPPILDYNLNNHILPISRYFISDLEFAPTEFRQILLKFPRLVTWSLFKIKHVVGYLRYELGMNASQVKRVLYQAPQVVGLTETNVKSKVEYLRETLLLSDEELRRVVSSMPTIILCSIDANLHPKIEFLRGVLRDNELRGAILLQPSLLGYSLNKRIQPRMQAILDTGAHPRAITVGISMKDDDFRIWLNGRRARLALDPGYDRVNKKSGEVDPLPIITPTIKPIDRNGRIVHWTRSDD